MKKRILFLFFSLATLLISLDCPKSFLFQLSSEEEKQVNNLLISYFETFESFANAGSLKEGARLELQVSELFEGEEYPHYNDLFEDFGFPPKLEVQLYLSLVGDEYDYQLGVDFEPIDQTIEGIENMGTRFAQYRVTKKMNYSGQKKEVNSLISINLDKQPFKINSIKEYDDIPVPSPEEIRFAQYLEQGERFYQAKQYLQAKEQFENAALIQDNSDIQQKIAQCDIELKKQDDANICAEEISIAHKKAEQKNYSEAIALYESAKNKCANQESELANIEGKIAEYQKILDDLKSTQQEDAIASLLEEANTQFNNQSYEEAKASYYKVLELDSTNETASLKVSKCNKYLNYQKYTKEGDQYSKDGFYVRALELYQRASEYINDEAIQAKIASTEKNIQEKSVDVKTEIEGAIAEFNFGDKGNALVQLYQYVDSGQMTDKGFYLLGYGLFNNMFKLPKKLGKDKKQAKSLGSFYLSKVITNCQADPKIRKKALNIYNLCRPAYIEKLNINQNCN